jgi:dCTP diphosphatase
MLDTHPDLHHLRQQLRAFVAEREWQQFHTPKNLASALAVEAAELLEPFQWLKNGELEELSDSTQTAIRHEMADVLNYLVMLADRLNVDLIAAAQEKIILNAQKYPVDQARGSIKKYTELKQKVQVSDLGHSAKNDK